MLPNYELAGIETAFTLLWVLSPLILDSVETTGNDNGNLETIRKN